MNRKIPITEKRARQTDKLIQERLTDIEKVKLKEHKAKIIYIDGTWHFIDMTAKPKAEVEE